MSAPFIDKEDNQGIWAWSDKQIVEELTRGTNSYGKYGPPICDDDHQIIREALARIMKKLGMEEGK